MNDRDYAHVTWRRGWRPALTLIFFMLISGLERVTW